MEMTAALCPSVLLSETHFPHLGRAGVIEEAGLYLARAGAHPRSAWTLTPVADLPFAHRLEAVELGERPFAVVEEGGETMIASANHGAGEVALYTVT